MTFDTTNQFVKRYGGGTQPSAIRNRYGLTPKSAPGAQPSIDYGQMPMQNTYGGNSSGRMSDRSAFDPNRGPGNTGS